MSKRTRKDRFIVRGRESFTGRTKETREFEKTLLAMQGKDRERLRVRNNFNIYGEGGMGKTFLLWEYDRICRIHNLQPIHIDVKLWDRPRVLSLVDFLFVLRKKLGQLPLPKLLGANYFTEFDKAYEKYVGLEEKRRQDEDKSNEISPAANVAAKLAVGIAEEFIPGVQTASSMVGQGTLEKGASLVIQEAADKTRDLRSRLLRLFGTNSDVTFYFNHEEILIQKLTSAVVRIADSYSIVILIDSYEELMEIESQIRERLFEQIPEEIVLVFAGRNSIKKKTAAPPGGRIPTFSKWMRLIQKTAGDICARRKYDRKN